METSSSDLKEAYRSMYALVKTLDDEKKSLTNASQLFEPKIINKRADLIIQCEQLVFKDHQAIGKKSREILWRKGYYEFIAFVKKNWHKENGGTKPKYLAKLRELLLEGIANYKRIATKMEEMYDLDLKLFIDFSIINDQNHDVLPPITDFNFDKSLDAASYALETIHSTLLSLGDLHRYFLDFKFERKPKITRESTARFYYEAFKLNPTIGMAQNQLGTLFYGQNYDLDSIYHYLYSLICTVPFELSENNVCKLFLVHAEHLERLNPDKVEFSLRDFYARFFLIVDIFFFDKDVPDFNSLCHCVLIDLRKVLCSKTVNITEPSLFKFICILMFCMSKLKMINSQKVYSLNAFLVAVCSDLIDSCIVNLEQFILARSKQNERFQELYAGKFNQFEATVRKNRENYKLFMEKRGLTTGGEATQNGNCKLTMSTDSEAKSQKSDRGEEVEKTNMTRSSDEAKESDLKTPLSNKSKKRGMKLRRRRKRVQQSDESSCYDSESDYDSDCSSNEEDNGDCTDLSSNFESDFSDIEEDNQFKYGNKSDSEQEQNFMNFSDNEDIVIEEESIIYPEDANQMIEDFNHLNMNGNLHFKSDNDEDGKPQGDTKPNSDQGNIADQQNPPQKLKYKNKYSKIDPNIIIDFACEEITLRSLKILFDWLRINYEILSGCYHTNPEFIHKIMKLLNYCNIDVFTRKVYFEREFISASNVRKDLDELFNIRSNIPLSEDVTLRNFDLLQGTQMSLDWEIPLREKVTSTEENIMRIFKMVDFGFFICKLKKFNYNFCPKTRRFSENIKKKREKKTTRKREKKIKGVRKRIEGRSRKYSDRRNGPISCYNTSNEEKDTVEESKSIRPASAPKKGYLRNRSQPTEKVHSSSGADDEKIETPRQGPLPQKCELMGKLWLRNEVETLEEKLKNRPANIVLTPYIVVDSRALTEYTGIVKSLVKSRKFIVLIPNAVLGDLDSLKKNNNGARNAIRWLEQEFKKGNRYIRSQRDNENLTLSLIKVPRKLDRDATVFLQIAQFCNYIVTNHNGTGAEMNIMTFLSGDYLHEKRHTNFSYTGIMDAIPVRYDQISNFYAKYRSK